MLDTCRNFKAGESLHERLRRQTAQAHANVETLIHTRCFLATRAGYIAFLQASLAFQAEAEWALENCGAANVIPDWPLRRRARLAWADLETLGSRPIAASSPAGRLTKVSSPAWVLGVAYVAEGATLGGGVLLKTVGHLDVSPNRGASFLAGYGSDRAAMWQAFCRILGHWEDRGIAHEEVVAAALGAFAAARGHFASVGWTN